MKVLSLVLIALGAGLSALAQQPMMDPALARDYEIGGLTVSGTTTVDVNAVMLFSGLKVGEKVLVPGPRIADAIKNIWDQKLFSDVRVEELAKAGAPTRLVDGLAKGGDPPNPYP